MESASPVLSRPAKACARRFRRDKIRSHSVESTEARPAAQARATAPVPVRCAPASRPERPVRRPHNACLAPVSRVFAAPRSAQGPASRAQSRVPSGPASLSRPVKIRSASARRPARRPAGSTGCAMATGVARNMRRGPRARPRAVRAPPTNRHRVATGREPVRRPRLSPARPTYAAQAPARPAARPAPTASPAPTCAPRNDARRRRA